MAMATKVSSTPPSISIMRAEIPVAMAMATKVQQSKRKETLHVKHLQEHVRQQTATSCSRQHVNRTQDGCLSTHGMHTKKFPLILKSPKVQTGDFNLCVCVHAKSVSTNATCS